MVEVGSCDKSIRPNFWMNSIDNRYQLIESPAFFINDMSDERKFINKFTLTMAERGEVVNYHTYATYNCVIKQIHINSITNA